MSLITNLWVKSKIDEAIIQLTKNFKRIKKREEIKFHNKFYHVFLDHEKVKSIIGLIILDIEKEIVVNPSEITPEIYKNGFPIHVLSWNNMKKISVEIDTVPDFIYYLNDREKYLKIADIPLCKEMEALGYYKSNNNTFPLIPYDFVNNKYWNKYVIDFSKKTKIRNKHNLFSIWMDLLENSFSEPRKLFFGLPIGLIVAWELGTLDRRVRSYFGEKFEQVQEWFANGNKSRRYAYQNPLTKNWLVFYFSISDKNQIIEELKKEMRYKLMIEIEENSFDFGVYGFGFQVSKSSPYQLFGLKSSIIMGADEMKQKYEKNELQEAYKHFGGSKNYKENQIKEFPT